MNHATLRPQPATLLARASLLARRIRRVRHLNVVGAATCLALALGACSDGNPAATPATPNTAAPPTAPGTASAPTPAPTTLSPGEAEERARASAKDYLALFDEISADPNRDVTELEQVASGRALDWATHQITAWREAGQTGVGAQVASDFSVTAVDLDPGDDPDDWYPTVGLTACIDLGETDLVDENGNSVVPSSRPDRVLVDYVVGIVGWPEDQHWRVVSDDARLTDSDPPEFVPCP
jgi:hypothetical protein